MIWLQRRFPHLLTPAKCVTVHHVSNNKATIVELSSFR